MFPIGLFGNSGNPNFPKKCDVRFNLFITMEC